MEKDLEKRVDASPVPDLEVNVQSEKKANDGDSVVSMETPSPQGVNPMDPSQFPDGGLKAWTVVFGAGCCLVVSFGWINCESPSSVNDEKIDLTKTALFQALASFRNTTRRINSDSTHRRKSRGSSLWKHS